MRSVGDDPLLLDVVDGGSPGSGGDRSGGRATGEPRESPEHDPADGPPGDAESVARTLCLRALTGAPKTRKQLADLLAARGVPESPAHAVLDRFTEVGLVDDAAYARAWVSSRQSGRGLARRALGAELRAKGVDPETAAAALDAIDEDDERAAALRLVERKLPAMRRLDRATASRRLVAMLARKGYGAGVAAAVTREALEACAIAAEDTDEGAAFDDEDSLLP